MKTVDGADWSIGFNSLSGDSLSQAALFAIVGRGLRDAYADLTKGPEVPEQFARLIERLEAQERGEG